MVNNRLTLKTEVWRECRNCISKTSSSGSNSIWPKVQVEQFGFINISNWTQSQKAPLKAWQGLGMKPNALLNALRQLPKVTTKEKRKKRKRTKACEILSSSLLGGRVCCYREQLGILEPHKGSSPKCQDSQTALCRSTVPMRRAASGSIISTSLILMYSSMEVGSACLFHWRAIRHLAAIRIWCNDLLASLGNLVGSSPKKKILGQRSPHQTILEGDPEPTSNCRSGHC